MRAHSVVAVVRARDHDREQLALGPRELRGPEHDRLVELHRARCRRLGFRHIALTMLKTLPARPIAASYSAFSGPVASPSSISRRFGTGPFCPFQGFKLHSWCRNAISVQPRGQREGELTVERSDDAGYDVERQGSSDEEATNGRNDHAETGTPSRRRPERRRGGGRDDPRTRRGGTPTRFFARRNADAAARVEELTREAERMRTEADDYARDIRAAVDSYGTQARREADEEARKLLADAEEQARATREAAQEMANQIEEDVRRRHESLARRGEVARGAPAARARRSARPRRPAPGRPCRSRRAGTRTNPSPTRSTSSDAADRAERRPSHTAARLPDRESPSSRSTPRASGSG